MDDVINNAVESTLMNFENYKRAEWLARAKNPNVGAADYDDKKRWATCGVKYKGLTREEEKEAVEIVWNQLEYTILR